MKVLTNIDLNKNELQNARIQSLATAPASPVNGLVYFNTTDKKYYGYSEGWINLGYNYNGEVFTDTLKSKLDGIATGATKVEDSTVNGNIKINGSENIVYTHPGSGNNPHGTTKTDVGLGSVDNKSSSTIRDELTTANVNKALGFTPKKITQGLESARPSATGSMAVYIATDTKKIWLDTAANTWLQVGGQDSIAWGNVTGKPSTFTPAKASKTVLGGVKVGNNLTVDEDGTINASDNPTSYIVKQEKFIATAGQKVFNLTKGKYRPGLGTLAIFLNGVKIANTILEETSQTSFTLKTGLSAGDYLLTEYVELIDITPYPIHANEHLPGGVDPIPLATISKDGLMNRDSLVKLNGIATGANNYSHPSTHPPAIISQDASNRFVTDVEKSTWNGKSAGNHNHTLASLTEKKYESLTGRPALGSASSKNTGVASGQVPLIGSDGKLDAAIMPAIAITDTFVVGNESSMLGLTVQVGDICVRTDLKKSLILKQSPANVLANWQELLTPTDVVQSVNGMTGTVTINKSNVGLSTVDNVQQASKTEFNTHNSDATKHITASERIAWNAKTKKYAVDIGNGSLTTIPVTHNLGTMDVSITVREKVSPYNVVFIDVQFVDTNKFNILFATAPKSNEYRVTVVG